jgi:hypothetical protein
LREGFAGDSDRYRPLVQRITLARDPLQRRSQLRDVLVAVLDGFVAMVHHQGGP